MVPEGRRPPPPGRNHGVSERSPNRLPVHDRVPAETKRDRTTRLPKISSAGWSFNRSAEPPSLAALRPWSTAPGHRISWGAELGRTASKKAGRLGIHVVRGRRPEGSCPPRIRNRNSQELLELSAEQNQRGVVFGTGWRGVTRGGIARGVAFCPAVPGLAPRGFYGGKGRGWPCYLAGLASEREAGSPFRSTGLVRHKSPQRELGDCDVAQGLAASHAGWRLAPQSPGSRPGAFMGAKGKS